MKPVHDKGGNPSPLLWAASLTAALGGFLFGFDTAVISGTLSFVKTQFRLTTLGEGSYVSSALVGCMVGVALAGVLSDRFGRKKALFFSSALFLVSTLGCTAAPDSVVLILSRLVAGMGIGTASMLAPLYISEISPPQRRGALVSLYQFAITLGIVAAYFSNAWVLSLSKSGALSIPLLKTLYSDEIWRGMFGNMLVFNILFLVLLFGIPESPRWLIARNLTDRARAVLSKIHTGSSIDQALRTMESSITAEAGSFSMLFRPEFRKAMLIGILLPVFSQFSGINAIIYYGPKILGRAGFSMGDALGGQVIIGLVNVVFTVLAVWQVDRIGRKPLLLTGIAGAAVCLAAIGFFFRSPDPRGFGLVGLIMGFTACFAFSYGPVTWIVISEIFPTAIRGRAMSLGTLALWGANTLVGQTFPVALESIGPSITFWLFAAICIPAFLFVAKTIPETRGKTLEQIEAGLRGHPESGSKPF